MLRMRRFVYRVLNYLRPTPVTRTLTIDQILADHGAMDVVERFTDLYYRSGAAGNLIWRDTEILKNPCDIWSAVELFQRLKPRVIVETGTHKGGSALLYSDMAKVLKFECTIVAIDPNPKWSVDPPPKESFRFEATVRSRALSRRSRPSSALTRATVAASWYFSTPITARRTWPRRCAPTLPS